MREVTHQWWVNSVALAAVFLLAGACGQQSPGPQDGDNAQSATVADEPQSAPFSPEDATIYIEAKGGIFQSQEFGEQTYGSGTGFVISEEGYALTANHVVTGASFLEVTVSGEDEPLGATVLGASECSDLALIDIEGGGFKYFERRSEDVEVGLDVIAAGYPADDVEAGVVPDYTQTEGSINSTEADGETAFSSVDSVY